MRSDIAVVILAGGEGKRIGGGKPLLRFRGERLVDRAIRLASRWSDLVAISVRDAAQVQPTGVRVIIDEPGIEGPLGGLFSALLFGANAGRDFMLTIPADMPFLPSDLLDGLQTGIGECACALGSSGGHLHPVCGLWRTSALDRIGTYLAGDRRSLKGFAALVGFREVEWGSGSMDPFFNINTPEDLAEASSRSAD